MFERMLRAAQLDVIFYEKVEADSSYTREAFQVVLLVSALSGLGVFIEYGGFRALVASIIAGVVGWVVWSVAVLWIGTTVTKGPDTRSDLGEILRVLGYACTPLALTFFSFVDYIGRPLILVAWAWQILAGIIAIRQALDFTTTRAALTVFLGWIAMIVVGGLFAWILGAGWL
jgi:hypothetical protein